MLCLIELAGVPFADSGELDLLLLAVLAVDDFVELIFELAEEAVSDVRGLEIDLSGVVERDLFVPVHDLLEEGLEEGVLVNVGGLEAV